MTKILTATQARVRFGELLREVEREATSFVVERAGKPAAVMVPFAEFEQLQATKSKQKALEATERMSQLRLRLRERGFVLGSPEEALDAVRVARDEQLGRLH